ncbi:DsbA family protein [Candidatus Uhrbacteria bacterium]|nr:MAG: DsbA family protein [Candidatus Uhrbacteria bacterium]
MHETSSNKGLIIGTIAVAVIIFGGLIWAVTSAPSENGVGSPGGESVAFNDEGAAFQGNPDAKVVVQIYSDYQCPACKAQEPAINYAVQRYADRVKFVWKDFPLMSIHPNARAAANAAWCANEQGKYWEYHDLLFSEQSSWGPLRDPKENFRTYANRVGINVDSFGTCYDARRYDAKVMAGVQEGNANRVTGTPTIFVNGVRHPGLAPADWDRVLQTALAGAEADADTSTTP